jgi:hypothetical protein
LFFAHDYSGWPEFFQALRYSLEHKIILGSQVSAAALLQQVHDSMIKYVPLLECLESQFSVKFSWVPFLPHYHEYFDSNGLIYDISLMQSQNATTLSKRSNDKIPHHESVVAHAPSSDSAMLPFAFGGPINHLLNLMYQSCPSLGFHYSASACCFLGYNAAYSKHLDSFTVEYSFPTVAILLAFPSKVLSTEETTEIYVHFLKTKITPMIILYNPQLNDVSSILPSVYLQGRILLFVSIFCSSTANTTNDSHYHPMSMPSSSLLLPSRRYLISFKYYTGQMTTIGLDIPLRDLLNNRKSLIAFIQGILASTGG